MKVVLLVAGSDSSGGAGLGADLRWVAGAGMHAATAITCVTAQGVLGLVGMWPLPPEAVLAQIDAVRAELPIAAVKIGMIGTPEIAVALARALDALTGVPVVLDPVLIASAGASLAETGLDRAILEHLVPRATLVTPNLDEAAQLLGAPVETPAEMHAAARALVNAGAGAALVKGGHLRGEPIDVLCVGRDIVEMPGQRIPCGPFRGTGCALASSIAAELARGESLRSAVAIARRRVARAIAHAVPFGGRARLLPVSVEAGGC